MNYKIINSIIYKYIISLTKSNLYLLFILLIKLKYYLSILIFLYYSLTYFINQFSLKLIIKYRKLINKSFLLLIINEN